MIIDKNVYDLNTITHTDLVTDFLKMSNLFSSLKVRVKVALYQHRCLPQLQR